MIKLKKKTPLIDQHDKFGFYGNKFGGNYCAETMRKPIEDLSKLFEKLRRDRNCLLYTSPSPRDRTRSRMPSSA